MDQWYVARGKERNGPYSRAQLQTSARDGSLQPTDMLLQHGQQRWVAAGEVSGLFPAPAAPPVVVAPGAVVALTVPPGVVRIQPSVPPAAPITPTSAAAPLLRRPWLLVAAGSIGLCAFVVVPVLIFGGKTDPPKTGEQLPQNSGQLAQNGGQPAQNNGQPLPPAKTLPAQSGSAGGKVNAGDAEAAAKSGIPGVDQGPTEAQKPKQPEKERVKDNDQARKEEAPPAGGVSGADKSWLTEPERDFFAALGADAPAPQGGPRLRGPWSFFAALGVEVRVDGKLVERVADRAQLPAIARRAPQPLRGRIEAIAQAHERMKVTPEEEAQVNEFFRKGQEESRLQLGMGLLNMALGADSFQEAVRTTDRMMQGAKVIEIWKLQRRLLVRGLAARTKADAELARITGDLQRRLGKERPASDFALGVLVERNQLHVTGTAGAAGVRQPVLQLLLHKKSTGGQWTGLNVASGFVGSAMGLKTMDKSAREEGALLAAAQEGAMNLPLMTTVLLPSLDAGQGVTVSLGLPAHAALGIERVEARLWSGEGGVAVGRVPGLPEAQQEVTRLIAEARNQRGAARGSAPDPKTGDLLYKGSIWRGPEQLGGNRTIMIEIEILDRDGARFKADMRFKGSHWRYLEGTCKDGAVTWQGAKGERSPGAPHVGKLNGTRILGELHPPKTGGTFLTFQLDYVPPLTGAKPSSGNRPIALKPGSAELLVKGSVWRGVSYQIRPVKTSPQSMEIVVGERDGDNFKAAMRWNGQHLRNVAGRVDGGKIQWNGAAGERNPGGFNVGAINGKQIEVQYFRRMGSPLEDGTLTLEWVSQDKE